MPFSTLFFDVDDTLYPVDSGLWRAIRERMTEYMVNTLSFSPAEVDEMRQSYFLTHGTTLRGLMIHHPGRVDVNDFLAYVHDLPVQNYVQPNPALRQMLLSLPQKRWLFTNADDAHARRVAAALGIGDCFSGIVDIKALEFACKPGQDAYHKALALAGETDPAQCVFLDDSPRNLAPARALGFFTVMVGRTDPDPSANLSIASLTDLPHAMPELWDL